MAAMNKLLGMLAFTRVVEHNSFTAAARRMNMSVSAVAKCVARLEADLGAQLILRTTRQMAVTEQGKEFYARCGQILEDIENAERSLKHGQQSPEGRMRILLPASFGRGTFLPQLEGFMERYPRIVLDVHLNDRPVDLISQQFDLAVHIGALDESTLISRVLTRGPRVTGASPAYLKKHGEPKTPEDLTRHNCVVSTFGAIWPYRVGSRYVKVRVPERLLVSSSDAMREAALLGLGIIQANWWTVKHDIAAGRIRPLLTKNAVEGNPISLVYPASQHVPQKLRVLISFLEEITRASSPSNGRKPPVRPNVSSALRS
jgi:DNA-binding transcriptional LysR family regulator